MRIRHTKTVFRKHTRYLRVLRGEGESRVRGVVRILVADGLEADEADGGVREVAITVNRECSLVLAVLTGAGIGREDDRAGGGQINGSDDCLDHGLKFKISIELHPTIGKACMTTFDLKFRQQI